MKRPARFPTLVALASAAGLFALLQAGFILLRQQDFDELMALALAKLGLIAGLLTVLLLLPLVLLARRWHPQSHRGDRRRATRSLLYGLTAALATWMLVDSWVAGPLVPRALEPWLETAAALAVGWAVARRPPSERFARLTAPVAVVALLLLLIPGPDFGGAQEETDVPESVAAGLVSAPPDVVLVSIDTLRSDRLGAYGRSPTLTPEMDRIAGEGFLFERALAASPWTIPSVASMLTGLPTVRHGAGLPLSSGLTFRRSPLGGDITTLAQRFSAAGYRTRAVVANAFLSRAMGMARGFEVYEVPLERAMGAIFPRDIPLARLLVTLLPPQGWADYRAQGITDRALEFLAEEAEAPLFLWVHYIDPHTPFQSDPAEYDLAAWSAEIHQQQPEVLDDGTVVGKVFAGTSNVRGGLLWLGPEDRRRIEEYYDRTVSYVDGEVGRLFAALRQRLGERRVVAVLTSDHGEEFWDHGHFEHGHDYYRELTRIPLVFWAPGVVPAGRGSGSPVGLVDVAPTLLDLAGLEVPAAEALDEGRTLVRWLGAPPRDEAAGAVDAGGSDGESRMRFSEGNLYGLPAVLLEDERWRFILRANGAMELYNVVEDPAERYNRVLEQPELVERYRAVLEPRLAVFLENRASEAAKLDPETLKALQALGYVQ